MHADDHVYEFKNGSSIGGAQIAADARRTCGNERHRRQFRYRQVVAETSPTASWPTTERELAEWQVADREAAAKASSTEIARRLTAAGRDGPRASVSS